MRIKKGLVCFVVGIMVSVGTIPCYATPNKTTENAIQTETKVVLTAKEKEYRKKHPNVTIALDTSWIPYALYNQNTKKAQGIIPNVFDKVCERVGLKAKYIHKNTYLEAIQTARSGEAMLVSGIANDTAMAKKNHVNITDPYITINYTAITKDKIDNLYTAGSSCKVAVCVGSYSTMAMKKKMPSYQFVEYHSNAECMKAVNSGKVDMALIATYAAEYYSGLHEYGDLHSVLINNFSWGLCFGVNKSVDPVLIDILNKGIASLSESDVNQTIYGGLVDAANSNQGAIDWVYEQPIVAMAILVFVLIGLLIIIVLVINHIHRTKELKRVQELNQKLTRANHIKQDFMGQMSHELRTPMNAIVGMARLGMEEAIDEESKQYFQKIDTSGDYLLGLINDLLDMNRLGQSHIELHEEPVIGSEYLRDVLSIIQPLLNQKNIKLEMNLEQVIEAYPYVLCDMVRTRQIYINILSNAIKFSGVGSTIVWNCKVLKIQDDFIYYEMKVVDQGCGMSEEFLEHIFEPFTQEHNIYSSENESTGLGLAITKGLVEIMGGTIEVSSQLGKGTTVTVCLHHKLLNQDTVLCQKPSESHVSLSQKRVLVVEDHPLNLEIDIKLLEKQGMIVETAVDGAKGVEAVKNSKEGYFDAILMDVRMPVMDGLEATRAIRALNRNDVKEIPIIATTANAFEDDKRATKEAGMTAHLSKPIDPKLLYKELRECIR